MNTLILPAPAKINRFLHINAQREDGYHEIQTIFQFIDLADQLTFTINKAGKLNLHYSNSSINAKTNLIMRAAKALHEATSCNVGIDISITKNIPIGGGLGGGSSDAATTLLALNHLWQTKLTTSQLIEIGVKLGADIPIFIHGHSAWAEGIGDQLQTIDLPEGWMVLIAPPVHVATAEIFFDKALSRDTSPCKMSASLVDTGHNDCEPIVRQHYPEVAKALDWLSGFAPARITGTGGCIFAAVASQKDAEAIIEKMPKNCKGFVVHTLNQSPVMDLLA